jgi:benzoate-CoA ligase
MAAFLVDRQVTAGRGGRAALLSAGGTVTYAQLQQLVNRVGNALLALSVQAEQRVALLLPDCVEFVATFVGAMKIGAVPVPLNTAAPPGDVEFFLSDSRARVLVTTPELAMTSFGPALAEVPPSLKAVLLVSDAEPAPGLGPLARRLDATIAAASSELSSWDTRVDEPCYWLYSSGTTGRPKGVVHLQGDMLPCVVPYAEDILGICPEDRIFSVARLFFSYGLVNTLFLPLLAGASSVLVGDRPTAETVLQIARAYQPTLLFGVPTSYAQLCAALESDPSHTATLQKLRLAVTAGEALAEPLYWRWRSLTGVELLDGLGSTEVGYIFCSNRAGAVRPGSSGLPIDDHELKLVDEAGSDVLDDEGHGELWVRAASSAVMYWNQKERTQATFVGNWVRMGDAYRRDRDGYYWYEGRTNDLFKVSGQWVSPIEVETCLLERPEVQECAVVGVRDADGLVKPKAFVVARPGTGVTAVELQRHVRERLLPHKYPRWVEFLDELPKTATGKIQRFRLRDRSTIA